MKKNPKIIKFKPYALTNIIRIEFFISLKIYNLKKESLYETLLSIILMSMVT